MSSTAQVLLTRLVDDAGLFPPASKTLEAALRDHQVAREGTYGWMLGRFLCPASKLEDEILPRPVGVVSDGDWEADLAAAVRLEATAFELRDPGDAAYAKLGEAPVDVFVEGAGDFEALRAHRLGAKIRCGGISADAFPSEAAVASFIRNCREHGLPFKATAGLHHPFRTRDEALGVLQHGFVNLLVATALDDSEAVVAEADADAFAIEADGVRWRDAFVTREQVEEARGLFTAFGSCSFDEPVDDLVALGVIGG